MTKYLNVSLVTIKQIAFQVDTNGGTALLLQDLLLRMKTIKKEEGLLDRNFVFLQNPNTGEIKMEIV